MRTSWEPAGTQSARAWISAHDVRRRRRWASSMTRTNGVPRSATARSKRGTSTLVKSMVTVASRCLARGSSGSNSSRVRTTSASSTAGSSCCRVMVTQAVSLGSPVQPLGNQRGLAEAAPTDDEDDGNVGGGTQVVERARSLDQLGSRPCPPRARCAHRSALPRPPRTHSTNCGERPVERLGVADTMSSGTGHRSRRALLVIPTGRRYPHRGDGRPIRSRSRVVSFLRDARR